MTGTTTLICPKCRGQMRTYERNGVLVDQCDDCRGIFLDRGELEQLLDAGHQHGPTNDSDAARSHKHHEHDKDHDRPDEPGQGRRRKSASSLIADLLGGGE